MIFRALRSAEVQKSAREFSHGLDFSINTTVLKSPYFISLYQQISHYTLLAFFFYTSFSFLLNNQKRKTKSLFHVKSIMSVAVDTVKILQYAQHSPPQAKFVLTFEKTRRQSSVTAPKYTRKLQSRANHKLQILNLFHL